MTRALFCAELESKARGGEARLWLAEQSAYDVWQAAQKFNAAPMHVQPAPMMA